MTLASYCRIWAELNRPCHREECIICRAKRPVVDPWYVVWDWARHLWGDNPDHGFEHFFRELASRRAAAEGWEELGSSDVWHACFHAVKEAKARGVNTRARLEKYVRNVMGVV